MGIPQFDGEGVDQTGGGTIAVSFSGFTFIANDILEIVIATDGDVPVLSTANGFQIAQDPNGNTASVTTNAGTAGAAECGIFVYWKRATGNTATTDPPPVFGARTGGGTAWCLQPNSFTGARTTGTPYHVIASAIVSTATTAVTSVAVTSTLANCLFMPRVASSNDDSAFNAWTFTGSSGPSGSGIPNTGWHSGAVGNACAFTGAEGGFATAGGPHTATTTFATSTKQASVTLIMASLAEATAHEDEAATQWIPPTTPRWIPAIIAAAEEIPGPTGTPLDEDAVAASAPRSMPVAVPVALAVAADEELPGMAEIGGIADGEQAIGFIFTPAQPPVVLLTQEDELPGMAEIGGIADGEQSLNLILQPTIYPIAISAVEDELPGAAEIGAEDAVPVTIPLPSVSLATIGYFAPDDEIPTSGGGAAIVEEESPGFVALSRRPDRPILLVAPDDLPIVSTTPVTIVNAVDGQRSFGAAPQTGTLTTSAPVPAWTVLTAYVVDPTAGGINRVINGGNLYQCSNGGTSAATGSGPTGTGTTIADGLTVTWYFVGVAQGSNTIAGSQIIATVMRGNQSLAGSVDPTDNDGGTYTAISNTSYGGAFPSAFAGVWRRTTASNIKTGFTLSAVWGGSSGAGDELSLAWIELQGVVVGAPHAFSEVDRANSTGGTVTAGAITTTKRCIIVSYWFGIGTVQATGAPDAATPAGGLTLIAGSTGPLSLTSNGYVQHMAAWRMANPGTGFAEVWTASPTDQGAKLVTVAFEDPTVQAIIDDDCSVAAMPLWAPRVLMGVMRVDDELAAITVDDGDVATLYPSAMPTMAVASVSAEEIPGQVIEDDAPRAIGVGAMPQAMPVAVAVDDELSPVVVAEDDAVTAMVPGALPSAIRVAAVDDELVMQVVAAEDDVGQVAGLSVLPSMARVSAADDDLPVTAVGAAIDDDVAVVVAPAARMVASVAMSVDDDLPGTASIASMMDDDSAAAVMPATGVPALQLARAVDDEIVAVAPAMDDEPAAVWTPGRLAVSTSPSLQSDEDVPVQITPVEDDVAPSQMPTARASVAATSVIAEDLPAWAALEEDVTPAWWFTGPRQRPPDTSVDDDVFLTAPPPSLAIIEEDAAAPWQLYPWPTLPAMMAAVDELPVAAVPTPPAAFYGLRVVSHYVAAVAIVERGVSMAESFRQNMRSPVFSARAFTVQEFVDFTGWTALTFRMVGPVVVTGPAIGLADGTLTYNWAIGDLAVPGTYAVTFSGVDPTGLPATFPTGTNLEIVVVPGI